MAIDYREVVAVLQVICYFPALFMAIFLAIRHGFTTSSGWVLLITFSLLRLIGAICQIISVTYPSSGVITTAIVCISIGLSPLTLFCLGLLSRVNKFVYRPIGKFAFSAIGILCLVGLSLGIYGGIKGIESTDNTTLNPYTQAAVVIFTLIFFLVIAIFCYLCFQISYIPKGEKRILLAVAISAPFLAVRLTYALVTDFAHNPKYNPYSGNVTIYLCMAVLQELLVVFTCESIGFTLPKIMTETQHELEEPPVSENLEHRQSSNSANMNASNVTNGETREGGNLSPKPRRKVGGPISWLIRLIKESLEKKDDQ